jgi:hypothetical protein
MLFNQFFHSGYTRSNITELHIVGLLKIFFDSLYALGSLLIMPDGYVLLAVYVWHFRANPLVAPK